MKKRGVIIGLLVLIVVVVLFKQVIDFKGHGVYSVGEELIKLNSESGRSEPEVKQVIEKAIGTTEPGAEDVKIKEVAGGSNTIMIVAFLGIVLIIGTVITLSIIQNYKASEL